MPHLKWDQLPDYVEDDQDYLDFLTDALQHGDGEGPIASLIEALLLENGSGIRSQHIDRILRSDDVASLVQDSDDELQNEGMLLNCFGHMMYQFINFLSWIQKMLPCVSGHKSIFVLYFSHTLNDDTRLSHLFQGLLEQR